MSDWTRKHDDPQTPIRRNATVEEVSSLSRLIALARTNQSMRATGSHWSLSDAALSDDVFVETHNPRYQPHVQTEQRLDRTIHSAIPACMNRGLVTQLLDNPPATFATSETGPGEYYVHVESGKRLYQIYSELDYGFDGNPDSLAAYLNEQLQSDAYSGAWALPTMGGGAGQTIVGALTTGTHGADVNLPPLADVVAALHLVAANGLHFWIEPRDTGVLQVADARQLHELYGGLGAPFEVVFDSELFNAVLISSGRFGFIYSVVLRVQRQYSLKRTRTSSVWSSVKQKLIDNDAALFAARHLTISINPTGMPVTEELLDNTCSITQNTLAEVTTHGQLERRGGLLRDEGGRLVFENAGHSSPLLQGDEEVSFLSLACRNPNLLKGLLEQLAQELKDFVDTNGTTVGAILGSAFIFGGGAGGVALGTLLAIFGAIIPILAAVIAQFGNSVNSLGDAMGKLQSVLLQPNRAGDEVSDESWNAVGLALWRAIYDAAWRAQQPDVDYDGISYAILDGHDYLERSCRANVDSAEIFFQRQDPLVVAFVDALIGFQLYQELNQGRSLVGYISLRFTKGSRALLAPQMWDDTCAIEISGLRDAPGTTPLVDHALWMANLFGAPCHWGQRNNLTADQVLAIYGERLERWRVQLLRVNGFDARFSSEQTRAQGLEP